MDYKELFDSMKDLGMIQDNWKHVIELLKEEISDVSSDVDSILKLFICYFSLIDDGNVYMTLDEAELDKKLQSRLDMLKIQYQEEDAARDDLFDEILKSVKATYPELKNISSLPIVGTSSMFCVGNNKLYTRKYFTAVNGIEDSIKRIFLQNSVQKNSFDYQNVITGGFVPTTGQDEVVTKGFYNNLFVTGGPGTGKTTSIFFLLLSLIISNPDYNVYLAAPSGKAAAKMKESILDSANKYVDMSNPKISIIVDKIKSLGEHTIHRLLQLDFATNGFKYNKYNRFEDNSIFVIDEASMIDVCLFDSLLSAIPDKARVFILGDKDQLPSVECGAVFGELLKSSKDDNKVELDESKRFSKTSEIYALAEAINAPKNLPVSVSDWISSENFEIATAFGLDKPIYYYSDDAKDQAKMIKDIVDVWYKEYYQDLQNSCIDLDVTDIKHLKEVFDSSEGARILCASNNSTRGTKQVNKMILKEFFNPKNKVSGYYPGEILMINTNNYSLDLYNGDCGVAVKFVGDDVLYIMFNKKTSLRLDDGKFNGRIFKISDPMVGDYIFYPAEKIGRDIVDSAFAITIHKSQGSDYNNILVILPKSKGHPLLNRQIVYTAITRTKGSTYILSNQENLECARDTVLKRNTF